VMVGTVRAAAGGGDTSTLRAVPDAANELLLAPAPGVPGMLAESSALVSGTDGGGLLPAMASSSPSDAISGGGGDTGARTPRSHAAPLTVASSTRSASGPALR